MDIRTYRTTDKTTVLDLILHTQVVEFGVAITAADQPDLNDIPSIYQTGNGNFWVATDHEQVIGTLALLDIGHQQVALRKMFVAQAHRGAEKGVAKKLLAESHQWARQQGITDIYLGTIDVYRAALRFYEKNGYHQLDKMDLPPAFPLIAVDNVFYHRQL